MHLTATGRAYTISRLMQTLPISIPAQIDPWRFTAEGGRLDGELALAALPRLTAVLEHAEGAVSVALMAGVDPQGIPFITGRLQTEIALACQRCLGSLQLPLDVAVSLGLVRDETEADCLPEAYEPLPAPEGFISVAELVENELLLALPQIPRHNDVRECEANGYRTASGKPLTEQSRPFATLASLL